MVKIYLDHNIIDKFDRGLASPLIHIFVNNEYLPIISLVSIDEIFRGGDPERSKNNIESLKKLGVKYIHSGDDESHMIISELDYEKMYKKWLEMRCELETINNSFLSILFTLFSDMNETEALEYSERAIEDQINWIKSNFDNFPRLQEQMVGLLKSNEKLSIKETCEQLIKLNSLRKYLPFTSKEINNIEENLVFWSCIDKLKNVADANLRLIADEIENAVNNSKTFIDQLFIVLFWLNFFGYYQDNLTRIEKIRSNFSDDLHATYCIVCDAILTLDKRFAKRITAAMGALGLKTKLCHVGQNLTSAKKLYFIQIKHI